MGARADTRDARIWGRTVELRSFSAASITEDYLAWLNDRTLMRYSRQRFAHHTYESALGYVQSFAGSSNRLWAVHRRADRLHVGTMTAYVDLRDRVADLGILIGHPAARGQGLGREAWGVAMDHLFRALALRKVTAGTSASNVAMVRIALHWRMRLEGIRREQECIEGKPTDIVLFGILRNEWEMHQREPIAECEEHDR